MRRINAFFREAWALARPYWSSEERWRARGLLALVIALNLGLVGLNVVLTYWQRAFYNALEEKDFAAFTQLILWGRMEEDGVMPGFSLLVALYLVVAVYALYLRQALEIRWRRWMTERQIAGWLERRAYYRMAIADGGADNPDQRIADDTRIFAAETLRLGIELMRAVVTLVSFVVILWGLSEPVRPEGLSIPGYLVWVALLYAALGTWLAHLIGRRLIGLNFTKQKVEADLRFALVRFRENTEGIALQGGEARERHGLLARFGAVIGNWRAIMRATKQLTFFTTGFGQVAIIFPFVVAAPAFFAGRIPLGALVQTSTAFGEVQGSLSWFVTNYIDIAEWRATVERLSGFRHALEAARRTAGEGPSHAPPLAGEAPDAFRAEALSLALPDGWVLVRDAALALRPGEAVAVTGASGSGKSTLFRALAGIWPFGGGRVSAAAGEALFLPQRPYIPLGSLRDALAYPHDPARYDEARILDALEKAGLGALRGRLDAVEPWERRLSGGEQQRLALARALLLRPRWLFLDEATASLDPAAEEALYATLRRELPETGILSIAHRPAVLRHHDRVLRLAEGGLDEVPGAAASPASQTPPGTA